MMPCSPAMMFCSMVGHASFQTAGPIGPSTRERSKVFRDSRGAGSGGAASTPPGTGGVFSTDTGISDGPPARAMRVSTSKLPFGSQFFSTPARRPRALEHPSPGEEIHRQGRREPAPKRVVAQEVLAGSRERGLTHEVRPIFACQDAVGRTLLCP